VRGAARVLALDNSGAVNASVALLVRSLNQAGMAVYARADERDLVAALRARRLGVDRHNGYRLDFFSIEDVAPSDRDRTYFSAELFAGVPCGISRRLPC